MSGSKLVIYYHGEAECRQMAEYFEEGGYQVVWCLEREEALDVLFKRRYEPDLVILDMDMPGREDYEMIGRIRMLPDIAVIVLSEDDSLDTQLYAYSRKIDDYILKPVPMPLLEAHTQAVLRRTRERRNSVEVAGELKVDYESRKVYLANQALHLTAKEFDLMEFFVRHKGMTLSRDKILDSVWGFDYVGGYRSVDTMVKKLRAKLTKEYPYIQTVYGIGYCFDI